MKKEIIRCDNCKKILDKDSDSTYFDVIEREMPGWASIDYSCGFDTNFQLCKDCFKSNKLIKIKQKNGKITHTTGEK